MISTKEKYQPKAKRVIDLRKYNIWIGLSIIMLVITIIRLRLLSVPLERDEGEYAFMGQLILQGIPPYEIVYNMKFPGTYIMYAFFMFLFGQSTIGVHLGLLIVSLSSILLFFLLLKKLINSYAAIVATSSFAFLSTTATVCGFAGHATHFVILPAIAGSLLLLKAITENNKKIYFLSGLLLGVTPLMKQQGIFFSIFGGAFLITIFFIYRKSDVKDYAIKFILFVFGGIIPFILMMIILKVCGVFDKFWFWTIDYAWTYEKQVPIEYAFFRFKHSFFLLWKDFYPIWIFAGMGFIALFIHPELKKKFRILFILLFFIFSFLSICPGFYFREHYFVTLIPATAILFGILVDYVSVLSKRHEKLKSLKFVSYGLFIIPILMVCFIQKDYFFHLRPNEISRMRYGRNPFPESINIANYIKANSSKEDKIAILGSEPQIYFYAQRRSSTGYIYMYSLMEIHKYSLKMQKEMINEIEGTLPKFFIYCYVGTSWGQRPNSEDYVFDWVNYFLQKNEYKIRGVVDIFSDKTIYKWDEEALKYMRGSESYILIFEREKQ